MRRFFFVIYEQIQSDQFQEDESFNILSQSMKILLWFKIQREIILKLTPLFFIPPVDSENNLSQKAK